MTVSTVTAIPVVAAGTFLSRFFTDFPLSDDELGLRLLAARALETLKSVFKPTSDWGPASKVDAVKYQDHLQVRQRVSGVISVVSHWVDS